LLTPENTNYVLKATGGGAYLFFDKLQERLPGVTIQKEDEMDCLITGKQCCLCNKGVASVVIAN
jgi:type II pantothenate kinase